jgi:hypothetical protein
LRKSLPEEKYRHSLPGESDALLAAVKVLERLEAAESSAKLVEGDPELVLLLKLTGGFNRAIRTVQPG